MIMREGERELSNVRIVHELGDLQISTMISELQTRRDHAYVPFSICRVPPSIRKADPSAYEPQIISIGPYHLQNPKLPDMGDLKRRYMQSLLGRRNPDISIEVLLKQCIEKVNKSEAQARGCYQVLPSLSSYEFVMMLVLDGCFIIELLHISFWEEAAEDDPICTIAWMFPSIWRDLLKLENQIPFFILEDLFSIISGTTHLSVKELAFYFLREKAPLFVNSCSIEQEKVSHLLHFFHILQRPYVDEAVDTRKSFCRPSIKPICYVLKRLMSVLLQTTSMITEKRPRNTVPCVVELREAGIKFSQNTEAKSMLDVTFEDGELCLPQLIVNDFTNSILRNLIAFEQFCPSDELCPDHHIAYYVTFLDYMINTAKDVTILEEYNIIENMLGSEDEVAQLFNQLGRDVNLDYIRDDHYLGKLFKNVNDYYDSTWHKHRATCMRDYFNSPWTIISVLAASAILIMTLIQVIYAVHS